MAEDTHNKGPRWQQVILLLMPLLFSGFLAWLWDIRHDLSVMQRAVYEHVPIGAQIPAMQSTLQAIATEHAVQKRDMMLLREMVLERLLTIDRMIITMDRQIMGLSTRLRDPRAPEQRYQEEGP